MPIFRAKWGGGTNFIAGIVLNLRPSMQELLLARAIDKIVT